ncbi:uncharacterized protein FOMMEDRAFT_145088 [Fomitiporia mediterranea MF3/22]|uniref:uncharacterized protein n=1 Tax=Fomitiporia mediterranea (strain MF3/22) TaxID=694068 RepID=UPI0004407AAA|nr:uncharacterized protein FOMMEDRAFT_145088 [Fomitiporia mediterranea MF3/22]EJD05610.1 hypothetical protein FOMMEDRAFT_145088 [Fomitiporia mediterranea MF3/22]
MLEDGGNPYCSDRVSTLLQRCTKDALATEDRDEAAMLLTLCDRARDYPPPMECETFGTDAEGADKASVRRCIIALDQHQNFQRAFDVYRILVIPEKCKTLNGIFNVDPSREIYRNMTRDLIGFLQFFARKESETENHLAQWDDRLNNTAVFMKLPQTLNATFEDIAIATQRTNEETSLKHAATLASAVIHLEQSLSTELDVVFNAAQERQNHLDLAAAFTIEQLMGAVNDLSVARQEFEALGIFVKEATAKAYSQAMLLDNKHYELSESISDLGTEIRGLANTTRRLNQSLTDIKDEAAEHYYFADRPADVPWLKVVGAAKAVLHWMGLSPFWALSLLMLSLPRFLVEQTIWALFWIFSVLISYAKKVILSHRTGSNCDDTEKVAGDRVNL